MSAVLYLQESTGGQERGLRETGGSAARVDGALTFSPSLLAPLAIKRRAVLSPCRTCKIPHFAPHAPSAPPHPKPSGASREFLRFVRDLRFCFLSGRARVIQGVPVMRLKLGWSGVLVVGWQLRTERLAEGLREAGAHTPRRALECGS